MKNLPVWFERAENVAIAVLTVATYTHLHFAWYWLFVFFLAFDLSMLGYLVNKKVGAIGYNLIHNYAVPSALLLTYVLGGTRWCAFVGLLWASHIAVDRAQGYGLKLITGFEDTHLGKIGKNKA
ncbi:MAG: DUF4260 domain-containing protein [Candidatus Saccharimonadales bacterium]